MSRSHYEQCQRRKRIVFHIHSGPSLSGIPGHVGESFYNYEYSTWNTFDIRIIRLVIFCPFSCGFSLFSTRIPRNRRITECVFFFCTLPLAPNCRAQKGERTNVFDLFPTAVKVYTDEQKHRCARKQHVFSASFKISKKKKNRCQRERSATVRGNAPAEATFVSMNNASSIRNSFGKYA